MRGITCSISIPFLFIQDITLSIISLDEAISSSISLRKLVSGLKMTEISVFDVFNSLFQKVLGGSFDDKALPNLVQAAKANSKCALSFAFTFTDLLRSADIVSILFSTAIDPCTPPKKNNLLQFLLVEVPRLARGSYCLPSNVINDQMLFIAQSD